MSPVLSVLPLLLFVGAATGRTLGNCDSTGQNCDWVAYAIALWKTTVWAWVIAGIMLGVLLVYLLLLCCCCCCGWLVKLAVKATTCCCRHGCVSKLIVWLVRITVLVIFVAGIAGFILAILGWTKVNPAVNTVADEYDEYLTVTLKVETDSMVITLANATGNLTRVGQLTNQSNLLNVLSYSEVQAPNTTQQEMVGNWTKYQKEYANWARIGWNWLFWLAITIPFAIVFLIAIFGIIVRCGHLISTILTILGLAASVLIWSAIAVSIAVSGLFDDVCAEAAIVPLNPSRGYGLTEALQCSQPANESQFASTASAYNKASGAAVEGACGSVRPQCSAGSMACPAIPATCTSYPFVQSLGMQITVVTSAADGGCDNQCTARSCANVCTNDTLQDASQGLELSIQTASALNYSNVMVLTPVISCQFLAENFIVKVTAECSAAQKGSDEIILGMVILAAAGMLGIVVTFCFTHWFKSNRHGSDSDEDSRSRSVDLDDEQQKEDAFQQRAAAVSEGLDALPSVDGCPTPAVTPASSMARAP